MKCKNLAISTSKSTNYYRIFDAIASNGLEIVLETVASDTLSSDFSSPDSDLMSSVIGLEKSIFRASLVRFSDIDRGLE